MVPIQIRIGTKISRFLLWLLCSSLSCEDLCPSLSCGDFRGIAISPVISKVFDYCFLQKFGDYLYTDRKQFDFKNGIVCNHAINTVRCVIEQLTKLTKLTVNLCAIDLSKAFDKVNHHALLIQEAQLMLTTGSTRLAVSRGQQTWYHSTCNIQFPIVQ